MEWQVIKMNGNNVGKVERIKHFLGLIIQKGGGFEKGMKHKTKCRFDKVEISIRYFV